MDKFVWTAIAVIVGIWAYTKITMSSGGAGPKAVQRGPAGYPIDQITGVEVKPGDKPGTVGFASGSIDNFRGPDDGALSGSDGSWGIDYGQKL
jgi:hypothetical protein